MLCRRPTDETSYLLWSEKGELRCESCFMRRPSLARAYSPRARPKHNVPAAADIMAMVRWHIMAMRFSPQSPLTTGMRLSPRTTGTRPQCIPHTGILRTTAMVAIMEVVGTDMGRQQSACAVDFMATVPEL